VTAARLVTVTLARAWDPGETPEATGTIEFAIALDHQGHPDVQAWLDDPAVWPSRRLRPGAAAEPGDVAHDEDGWQLRFFGPGGTDPDVPVHRICHLGGGLRPGEVLTLRGPDGRETSWRVVGVTPPES
jgi:hypothetical protein